LRPAACDLSSIAAVAAIVAMSLLPAVTVPAGRGESETVTVAIEGGLSLAEQLLQGAPERLPRGLAEVELACQLFQREAVPVRIAQGGGHRLDLDFHGEGT